MLKTRTFLLLLSISLLYVWNVLSYALHLIDAKMLTTLWAVTAAFAIYNAWYLIDDFHLEDRYIKWVLPLFFLYEGFLVIRGISFSYDNVKIFLQESYVFWPFVIPLFIFFNKSDYTLYLVMRSLYIFGILYLLLNVAIPTLLTTRQTGEDIIDSLAFGAGLILMNGPYFRNSRIYMSFLVILVALFSMVYMARRNAILTLANYIVFAYLLNQFNSKKVRLFRLFPFILGGGILFVLNFTEFTSGYTSRINNRLTEDTRSDIFQAFFADMRTHMAIGKGMNGAYYFPMSEYTSDDGAQIADVTYRNAVENGYLQLLLTGGIIHVILFLLVLLPAAYKGIFKSANQFARSCGVFVLLWLIDMCIYGLPRLTLRYVLVWICVGVCYKTGLRAKTDEQIRIGF